MKREEAIEALKKKLDYYESDKRLKAACETLIPELCESKGERIRKWILEYLYDGLRKSDEQFKDQFKSAIAWLEKQKAKERLDRMAPIYNDKESFESALEKAWKYYNESASRTVDSFEDDYIECVFSKGFREGFLYREKQKEQKPAEWSYPYGRNETADRLVSLAECLEMDGDCLFNGYSGTECGKFLRELARKQVECEPAEWSEEDKKVLNELLDHCNTENATWYNWLKTLKNRGNFPKINTNSPSWSEEDEEKLSAVISLMRSSRAVDPFYDKMCLEGWLKSLRPQPKVEWTIKNAKPGDILTTGTVTFIFKSVDKNGVVSMYCSYAASTTGTNLNLSDTSTIDSKYVHPTSIEQRREFLEELLRHISSLPHWKPSEEQPELTEFEMALDDVIRSYRCDSEQDENGILSYQDWIKRKAKNLLELAKKELCPGCNENLEGYIKGREDARKEMEYKHEGPTIPAYWPSCHYGGECTNPFRDCVNCPRGSVTVGINTSTGTSTAKAEGQK